MTQPGWLLGRSFSCLLLVVVVGRCKRLAGLRLHRGLVNRGGAGDVGVEGGAGGNEVVIDLVGAGGAGADRDAAGIDALLLDQVVLGVDGTLRGQILHDCGLVMPSLASRSCFGGGVAHHNQSCIGRTLRVERDVIEAALGVVVYASRTALVVIELDGAQRLGLRRRRRRCFNVDGGGGGSSLPLIVGHTAGHGNRAGRGSSGGEGGGVTGAAYRTGRSLVAVGQRTVLRADALGGDRRAVARLHRRRIGRAAYCRRLKLLDRELCGAIGRLAGL